MRILTQMVGGTDEKQRGPRGVDGNAERSGCADGKDGKDLYNSVQGQNNKTIDNGGGQRSWPADRAPWIASGLTSAEISHLPRGHHHLFDQDGFPDPARLAEETIKLTVKCPLGCRTMSTSYKRATAHLQRRSGRSWCVPATDIQCFYNSLSGADCTGLAGSEHSAGSRNTPIHHTAHTGQGHGVPCRWGQRFPSVYHVALHVSSDCVKMNGSMAGRVTTLSDALFQAANGAISGRLKTSAVFRFLKYAEIGNVKAPTASKTSPSLSGPFEMMLWRVSDQKKLRQVEK